MIDTDDGDMMMVTMMVMVLTMTMVIAECTDILNMSTLQYFYKKTFLTTKIFSTSVVTSFL